jgi:flagellar biogenesis protein FliO
VIQNPSCNGSFHPGGLAGWLLRRMRRGARPQRRLAVLERVTLGPRQFCSLVEADGQRFLVATSADGTPCFQPLAAARTSGRRASW